MSKKEIDYDDDFDDDDEEDEGDFVPGADDDDDDDFVQDDDDEEEHGSVPPVLQGEFFQDSGNRGAVTFKSRGTDKPAFCIVSTGPVPDSWSLQSPKTPSSIECGGWIGNPGNWESYSLSITKECGGVLQKDPMTQKMLKAQREGLSTSSPVGKSDPNEDDKPSPGSDSKKPPPAISSGSLKAPPPYSLKDPPTSSDTKKASPEVKNSPADDSNGSDCLYSLTLQQTGTSGPVLTCEGVFEPQVASANKICLICTTKMGTASPSKSPPAAAAAAPAKRSRANDDDEASDNDEGVEYNELIALHDDARLSTEELRLKYYGGGVGKPPPMKRGKSGGLSDEDDSDVGF